MGGNIFAILVKFLKLTNCEKCKYSYIALFINILCLHHQDEGGGLYNKFDMNRKKERKKKLLL